MDLMNNIDWAKWASPQGLVAVGAVLGMALSVLKTIFTIAGKKDLAAKVEAGQQELATKQVQIVKLAGAAHSIIQGVENARGSLAPDQAALLVKEITAVTNVHGTEPLVKTIVDSVTDGDGSTGIGTPVVAAVAAATKA
jgi:hypothetical protein